MRSTKGFRRRPVTLLVECLCLAHSWLRSRDLLAAYTILWVVVARVTEGRLARAVAYKVEQSKRAGELALTRPRTPDRFEGWLARSLCLVVIE